MDDQRTDREGGGNLSTFWTLIIVSGLPLFGYPAVLLADFMSLAAPQPKEPQSVVFKLAFYGFLLSTTLYPVVFFVCGAKGWDRAHWGSTKATMFWALAPLFYLLLIAGLYVLFGAIYGRRSISVSA